ncbi:MAG TPA: hypothetical protein VG457_11650 [Planctomycetota bacterium]|jgi:hypothetical protein|nr:hypothetical protein [Planctomycetota bacterium]
MTRLQLELADGKTKFRPGETVEGVAFWELDAQPESVEIRLFWRTQGKGTVDVELVQSLPQRSNGPRDRRPFRFVLPSGPYSVSGILISIVWGVEVVTEPTGESASAEITVSPTGEEVRLQKAPGK